MIVCTRCILDERFPGISFDEAGICNYCRSQKSEVDQSTKRDEYDRQFRELIEKFRGKSVYDCLVAYSGGKDSTYTLHLLKERYDVRSLAFSFDNWYQSDAAMANIKSVIKGLGVDHLTVMPSFDVMRGIIGASISRDLHPAKALERASGICTSCISLIRNVAFRMAIEQKIPFVVFGLSPGQAPLGTSVVKINPRMSRATQDRLLKRMREHVGDGVRSLFLEERHFEAEDDFPYSVNPLAFVEYDEEVIYDVISRYGWRKPTDTDANSTNCRLNAVANHVHIKQFGYNPYAYEIAEMVRSGRLSREEGLERLRPEDGQREQVDAILEELEVEVE